MAMEPAVKPTLAERMRGQRERHLRRSRPVRAVYAVAGVAITLAGVAMMVLPGPGIAAIVLGLAILSLEFSWAERLLERAIAEGERAKRRAAETSGAQRALTATLGALALAAVGVWAVLGDIPLAPV